MVDLDNPRLVIAAIIAVVFIAPFVYSFFIDNYDKSDKEDH